MKTLVLSTCVATLMSTGAFAATLSTFDEENRTISSWGLPNTSAYGQTFSFDTETTLNDIIFRINDYGTAIDFTVELFAWTGSVVSGDALSSSTGTTSGLSTLENVSGSLGDTTVDAGDYVVFFQATTPGSAFWGSSQNSYDGGGFVYQNNGGDISQWDSSSWTSWGSYDLSFELTYDDVAPVPLPASLPMLLAGFGGLAYLRRRKDAA